MPHNKKKWTFGDLPTKYSSYKSLITNIGLDDKENHITPENPWVCFSNEFGVSDLVAAGGLGYLAGDWVLIASKMGIPFIGIGLYYRSKWHQEIDESFRQREKYYRTLSPGKYGFVKVKKNGHNLQFKYSTRSDDVWIQTFTKIFGGNSLFMLCESGIGGLYEGEKHSEHRLYQAAVLGFAGIWTVVQLGIHPGVLHLNESSTVIAALSLIDVYCQQGMRLNNAIERVSELTLFTNHTLSPAAEPEWKRDKIDEYITPNLRNREVADWFERVLDEEGGQIRLCNLALRLSGKVNAVSKLHAKKANKSFGRKFVPVTNAISTRWLYPAIWKQYKKQKVIDVNSRLPSVKYEKHLDKLSMKNMKKIKKDAKTHMIGYLQKERKDQYGKAVKIPKSAKVLVWARRFDSYKRPGLLFTDTRKLASLLKRHNMHLLLSGKAHQTAESMKSLMQKIFRTIDRNEILKNRVHFIKDYDWRVAKHFAGADALLNTPKVGWEACGTSWEKGILNWLLLATSPDGGPADICPPEKTSSKKVHTPCFLIEGNNDKASADSLYENIDKIGKLLENDQKWREKIVNQLKAFFPICSGPRMMLDYIKLIAS